MMAPDGVKGDAGMVLVPIRGPGMDLIDEVGRMQGWAEKHRKVYCLAMEFMAAHEARVASRAELFEAMAAGDYWSTRDKADDVAAERLEAAREALFAALKE